MNQTVEANDGLTEADVERIAEALAGKMGGGNAAKTRSARIALKPILRAVNKALPKWKTALAGYTVAGIPAWTFFSLAIEHPEEFIQLAFAGSGSQVLMWISENPSLALISGAVAGLAIHFFRRLGDIAE